jgi:hypothetical protein
VSQLSDGISFDDLNIFSSYWRKDMSVQLPIKKNWQEHYLMLFEKDKQNGERSHFAEREDRNDEVEQLKLVTIFS